MPKNLTNEAQNVIQNYLHLPIPGHDISCPYYNNRRGRVRGALRVMVGKGSVQDIVEETRILSLKEKVDVKNLSNEQLKQFLVDHHVGIDCSALAYYILDAELKTHKKSGLQKNLRWANVGMMRRLLRKLRPVENTNVDTLADDRNSVLVELNGVQPGDFIIMLGFGPNQDRDHILVVHQIENDSSPSASVRLGRTMADKLRGGQRSGGGLPAEALAKAGVAIGSRELSQTDNPPYVPPTRGKSIRMLTIKYTHSLQWPTDGKYNHGARQGEIEIIDPNKPLTEQAWREQGMTGENNETWRHAKEAKRLEIRRLKALQ